jgi:thymidylate synthase
MVTELVWFLKGSTNIQFLVQNNCNIWNGDAYKRYTKLCSANDSVYDEWMRDNGDGTVSMFTMDEFVEKIKTDNDFASIWGDLGPIYGKQWRDWHVVDFDIDPKENGDSYHIHIDQIGNLINDLKHNPDSRRLMVSAWNVAQVDKAVLPPCHYGFQCWTRKLTALSRTQIALNNGINLPNEKKSSEEWHKICDDNNIPRRALSLMWNQRSVDTFLGLPFNIASYGLLLMMLAKEVNMVPEKLSCALGDTHLYLNHITAATEQSERTKFQLPTMELKYDSLNELLKNPNYLDCFELKNYQSHTAIKAELSN